MSRRSHPASTLLTFLLAAGLASACATRSSNPNDPSAGEVPPAPAVYADGWEEVNVISTGAKVDIDTAGHWETSRNACYRPDGGSMNAKLWAQFAGSINEALKIPALQEDNCTSPARDNWALDGIAEIQTSQGKRTLFDVRGAQVCTSIGDPVLAAKILDALDKTLKQAAYESCPRNN
jgi:hypothetical protein